MKLLLSYKAQAITLLFIWIVAMLFSAEFVLSLSMIFLVGISLFELKQSGQSSKITWRSNLKSNWAQFRQERVWYIVMVPFFLVLFAGIWSEDMSMWMRRVQMKLPFLILPFAFLSMPKFRKCDLYVVFYFLLGVTTVACLCVGFNYLADFEAINDSITKGKPIPTPSNHIRFSLAIALTILGGVFYFVDGFYFKYKWERWAILALTIFLFAFMHVLSVRSGLVALYFTLFALAIRYMIAQKAYLKGAIALAGLFVLPYLAVQLVPSLQSKIAYVKWDMDQYLKGEGSSYSDSERLTSLEVGYGIAKEHWLIGVGSGDLRPMVHHIYKKDYAHLSVEPRNPHNQLLYLWASVGVIGLLIFLFAFFYPLFFKKNFQSLPLFALYCVIGVSFLFENTLENNYGISLFLLFLLMLMSYLNKREVV